MLQLVLLVMLLALGSGTPLVSSVPVTDALTAVAADPVLVAAGDIASCDSSGDEATAKLLTQIGGTVATLGDHAYRSGSRGEFDRCYDPTWGRAKNRTRPAAGNHEYNTLDADAYFDYFGAAAGDRSAGYYSYDLGRWHVVVINSNCSEVGGCDAGSRQERWLRTDLAAHPAACTLAYWHHPRFSSGSKHGGTPEMQPIWQVLYDHDADLVLSGHEHHYERFALQDASGHADSERGIRQFVVGTGGGKGHYPFGRIVGNSEKRNSTTFGVLQLTLRADGYDWRFVPVDGARFRDSGSGDCH